MTDVRLMLCVPALMLAAAGNASGQWNAVSPFAGGAVLAGAQGFARPPITSAVTTAYAHLPVGALLVGGQLGFTFAESDRSHASYAVATVAWAQRRAFSVQMYPYLALGSAALRTEPGDVAWRPAFGAGFGIDALTGNHGRGMMLGARVGYLTRSMSDDESVAYVAIGLGVGARRGERHEPRTIAAR